MGKEKSDGLYYYCQEATPRSELRWLRPYLARATPCYTTNTQHCFGK